MKAVIPNSHFTQNLLRLNQINESAFYWRFHPGMLFMETQAWWENGSRRSPHEGIDLLFFTDQSGQQRKLPKKTMITPLWDGVVVAVFDDYLGNTVAVQHPLTVEQGWMLLSLYGHVRPLVGCGNQVSAGAPLARLAHGNARSASAPPDHLHLSLGWLAPERPLAGLSWSGLWNNQDIRFIDPLPFLSFRRT